jgi:hypothetical protein
MLFYIILAKMQPTSLSSFCLNISKRFKRTDGKGREGTGRRNEEQIEVKKCLLSFCAESLVFHFAIQKFKDYDTQNYNVACCFVWV